MPELPEVETIRLGLEKYLVGHTIQGVDIRVSKLFSGDPDTIIGAKVIGIKRFGKGLVIELDNAFAIAVHIKLTGQLIYQGADVPKNIHPSSEKVGALPGKFTHVIFSLDKQSTLYYNDVRQFGWIKVLEKEAVNKLPFFKELGPEPLSSLSYKRFRQIISSSKLPIKPLLMDQKKISGIGNIYANESLFLAKLLPSRPANSLSEIEKEHLFHAIEKVMRKGLETGGASELSFVNALGQEGSYQKHFLIYGKQGTSCSHCKTKIQKISLGGRGTYFCSTCQK